MAKAKKRGGKKKATKSKVARRKPAPKRKISTPRPTAASLRPVVIPGAWPFPMGSKT